MGKNQLNSTVKMRAIKAVKENDCSVASTARMLGVHEATLYRWLERHEKTGAVERSQNPSIGRPSKIDSSNARRMMKIISRPASKYGVRE